MFVLRIKNFAFTQVCVIEMGGTIGDIEGMPFVEAFRQFQFRVGKENFFCVHVSLVPQVCFIILLCGKLSKNTVCSYLQLF